MLMGFAVIVALIVVLSLAFVALEFRRSRRDR
jgi:heme/copper-type cytochrome/quinol oxidase subunit 2